MNLAGTHLVVLSACDSGLGDLTNDGLSGLSKAFKKEGVDAIIACYGKVDDKATSLFMKWFYHYLFEDGSIRSSFNKAVDKMKTDPIYSDPKYWAPFVLLK